MFTYNVRYINYSDEEGGGGEDQLRDARAVRERSSQRARVMGLTR